MFLFLAMLAQRSAFVVSVTVRDSCSVTVDAAGARASCTSALPVRMTRIGNVLEIAF